MYRSKIAIPNYAENRTINQEEKYRCHAQTPIETHSKRN